MQHEFRRALPFVGLTQLVGLMKQEKFPSAVVVRAPLIEIARVAADLKERRIVDKAVLVVDSVVA